MNSSTWFLVLAIAFPVLLAATIATVIRMETSARHNDANEAVDRDLDD